MDTDQEIVKSDSLELASKEHMEGSTKFEIDPHEERKLLRKLDILLLPLFTLICGYRRCILNLYASHAHRCCDDSPDCCNFIDRYF